MALTALLWEIAGISKKGKCKGRKKMISKKCIPGNGRVMINQIMSLLLKMCSRSFFTQSKSQGPYDGPNKSYRLLNLDLSDVVISFPPCSLHSSQPGLILLP